MLNIFDIQRFSWRDGPGIRTVVFFKGCNLRCFWCHNPESQSVEAEVLFYEEHCIRCGKCVQVCPHGCHSFTGGPPSVPPTRGEDGPAVAKEETVGEHRFDRAGCDVCGRCAEVCYSDALQLCGRPATVEDVAVEVLKDVQFYRMSGGGVALSGGEPLLQAEGCYELLRRLKDLDPGISTAIDTAGHAPWSAFEQVLPVTDCLLFDVKTWSSDLHRRVTGVSNTLILENLRALKGRDVQIIVRIPVIPGVNDHSDEVRAIVSELEDFDNVAKIELLPFQTMGVVKYRALGRATRQASETGQVLPEVMERLRAVVGNWRGAHVNH